MKINSTLASRAAATGAQINWMMTPSSNHPTGVNVSFCDGHTQFMSQDIDYSVFCLLMTPWGQMCNTPGTATGFDVGASATSAVYYPSGANNYGVLRSKPVDESQIK